MVALLAGELLGRLILDFGAYAHELGGLAELAGQVLVALHGVVHLQHVELVIVAEGGVGADECYAHHRAVHVLEVAGHLLGLLGVDNLEQAVEQVHAGLDEHGHPLLAFLVIGQELVAQLESAAQIRGAGAEGFELHAGAGLDDCRDVAVGKLHLVHDGAEHADRVQVALAGGLYLRVALGHESYHLVVLLGLVDELERRLARQADGDEHAGEDRTATQGQHRHVVHVDEGHARFVGVHAQILQLYGGVVFLFFHLNEKLFFFSGQISRRKGD